MAKLSKVAGCALVAWLCLLLAGCSRSAAAANEREAAGFTGGNPRAGAGKILYYGCGSCHSIAGITGARGRVGPPLDNVAERSFIAGHVPNTPSNLESWIQHPHALEPHTAMPEMNVSEEDSKDIAAYLYTLRSQ
jgi:cytochrome c2